MKCFGCGTTINEGELCNNCPPQIARIEKDLRGIIEDYRTPATMKVVYILLIVSATIAIFSTIVVFGKFELPPHYHYFLDYVCVYSWSVGIVLSMLNSPLLIMLESRRQMRKFDQYWAENPEKKKEWMTWQKMRQV